jgi:hypothetical protein
LLFSLRAQNLVMDVDIPEYMRVSARSVATDCPFTRGKLVRLPAGRRAGE